MAAKTDNTKQEIYNFVGATVEEIDGRLCLTHESYSEPCDILKMFENYKGSLIDMKLGGVTPLSGSMFDCLPDKE